MERKHKLQILKIVGIATLLMSMAISVLALYVFGMN